MQRTAKHQPKRPKKEQSECSTASNFVRGSRPGKVKFPGIFTRKKKEACDKQAPHGQISEA
jgi:hypothetical protein